MNSHLEQPLLTAGPRPRDAAATVILLHGRGAWAQSMLGLFESFEIADLAAVAPQASNHSWYPNSFLAPVETNQPDLDFALQRLDLLVDELIANGTTPDRIALLGFSQGACLALEFAARRARQYAAIIGLSGGLIGAPGKLRDYEGNLSATPVFLGACDPDPHVPFVRVQETEAILKKMQGVVELRRYAGMPHAINEDEIDACRAMLKTLVQR